MSEKEVIRSNESESLAASGEGAIGSDEQETWKIMIVDDDKDLHEHIKKELNDFSFDGRKLSCLSAYSSDEAKELINEHPDTSVILLEPAMESDGEGLELVEYIRGKLGNDFVRIILQTASPDKAPEQEVVAEYTINDYRVKSEMIPVRLATAITTALRSYSDIVDLEAARQEFEDTRNDVIIVLGDLLETRSKEPRKHVLRVSEYSYLLARKAGMSEEDAELLRLAAPLHDVGKVGIPDSIIKKPESLTNEEFEIMKAHTTIGHDILRKSKRKVMKAASIVALQHHERWDGNGYPQGLTGKLIHKFGRITCIADVFDSLSFHRVYKNAWSLERILNLFRQERGNQFDPILMGHFLDNVEEFISIRDSNPND